MNNYVLRPAYAKIIGISDGISIGTLGHRQYKTDTEVNPIKIANPLSLSISREDVKPEDIYDLIEIIKPVSKERIGFRWTGQKIMKFDDCVLIYPLCDQEFIYMTEAERLRLSFSNLDDLLVYKLVWSDLRAYPYLKSIDTYPDPIKLENVIVYHKVWLEYVSKMELQKRHYDLEYEMADIKTVTTNDESEMREWITAEIAMVWNFERTTANGTVYYSQNFQNLLVVKPQVKQVKPEITLKTVRAYAKTENVKITVPAIQVLPEIDLKSWLKSSVDRIIVGFTPLILLKSEARNLSRLHGLVCARNPWLRNFPPWSRGGIDYLPVLDPDDLLVYTGRQPTISNIPNKLPGKVIEDIVFLERSAAYQITGNKSQWQNGELTTVWASYLLTAKNFTPTIV